LNIHRSFTAATTQLINCYFLIACKKEREYKENKKKHVLRIHSSIPLQSITTSKNALHLHYKINYLHFKIIIIKSSYTGKTFAERPKILVGYRTEK